MTLKNHKKFILFLIFLIFFFIFYRIKWSARNDNTKSNLTKIDKCSYGLETNNPDKVVFEITNNGGDSFFTFKLNGNKFYESLDDLSYEIKLKEHKSTSIKESIFSFVSSNSYNIFPLTEENWYHNPLLFVNSLGFGFCDDTAKVFGEIMKYNGYNVRIVELGGHIVSEIQDQGGEWEMFDPDYGVYFKDENNKILDVDFLSVHPELITNPVNKMVIKVAKFNPYTNRYAELYSTKQNNRAVELDNNKKEDVNKIFFPSKGRIMFPYFNSMKLPAIENSYVSFFKNIKLSISENYRGKIRNPMVIQSFSGEGVIKYKNQEIDNLDDYKMDFNKFSDDVEIIEAKKNLSIFYLINPIRFSLKKENILEIEGENCELYEVDVILY